ncbi:MAG TPA: hypothetical protein VFK40_14895 [Nitrososphaeraceae archaeon]|nr:hypothetical protein [Nitrososphaeraceae archaeon]
MNSNTKYYTITSDWNHEEENCKVTSFLPMEEAGSLNFLNLMMEWCLYQV